MGSFESPRVRCYLCVMGFGTRGPLVSCDLPGKGDLPSSSQRCSRCHTPSTRPTDLRNAGGPKGRRGPYAPCEKCLRPSAIRGSGVSMDKEKGGATMNEALRMEVNSALKYLDLSFRVFGPTRKPIVEHFLEESKESFDHATMLGDKIVALGGTPVVVAEAPKVPAKAALEDILKMAIKNE